MTTIIRSALAAIAAATIVQAQSRPSNQPESRGGGETAFASLFQFCPREVESIRCVTVKNLPQELADLCTLSGGTFKPGVLLKSVRALAAGRKFAKAGDYEGMDVFELEKEVAGLADVVNQDGFSPEKIGGTACFMGKPKSDESEYGRAENWITLVDSKYLIFATRRSVLEEALSRKGPTPWECVERLGWKSSDVDWNAPLVIARKYDPRNRLDPLSPVVPAKADEPPKTRGFPIDRILFTIDAGNRKARLEIVSRDVKAPLEYFRELISQSSGQNVTEDVEARKKRVELARSQGDRHTLTVSFEHLENEWALSLWIQVIFGVSLLE
jgi:hypothetical protein